MMDITTRIKLTRILRALLLWPVPDWFEKLVYKAPWNKRARDTWERSKKLSDLQEGDFYLGWEVLLHTQFIKELKHEDQIVMTFVTPISDDSTDDEIRLCLRDVAEKSLDETTFLEILMNGTEEDYDVEIRK